MLQFKVLHSEVLHYVVFSQIYEIKFSESQRTEKTSLLSKHTVMKDDL